MGHRVADLLTTMKTLFQRTGIQVTKVGVAVRSNLVPKVLGIQRKIDLAVHHNLRLLEVD
jgi:hypothetical protein